jgi:hypothetical protein
MMRWKITLIAAASYFWGPLGLRLPLKLGRGCQERIEEVARHWVMVSGELGEKAVDDHVSRSKIVYEGQNQITVPNQTPKRLSRNCKNRPQKTQEMHFIRKNGPMARPS